MAKSKRRTSSTPASRPASGSKKKITKPSATSRIEKRRFWLMYPQKLIKRPVIWELTQKFPVVTNIRQASVTDEIGIVSLELEGRGSQIDAALSWLGKLGVSVEPVEFNVIES